MFTKVTKWSAIAALIGAAPARHLPGLGPVFQFTVVAAAVVVLTQAARMRRYVWMVLFLIVACLFNPVFAVPFSTYASSVATTFATLLFFFSLELLKPQPQLATGPVSDRAPGSRSI